MKTKSGTRASEFFCQTLPINCVLFCQTLPINCVLLSKMPKFNDKDVQHHCLRNNILQAVTYISIIRSITDMFYLYADSYRQF